MVLIKCVDECSVFLFLGLGVILYFSCIVGNQLAKIVPNIMFLSSLLVLTVIFNVVQVCYLNRHGIVQIK